MVKQLGKNRLVFISAWVCIIFISGCWDSRNIEDISLEVASGFDKADEQTSEETDEPQEKPFVTVTMQSIVPQQNSGGSDVANEQKKAYKNIIVTGKTFIEAIRKISLQEPRPPFGQHTKVIVIGNELAREMDLQNVLNLYLRTYEIRRSSTILIAKGKARQVLELSGDSDIPAFRLLGIYENQSKTNELLPIMTLGQTASKMAAGTSFVLQTVEAQQGKAKFDGGAIIKGSSKRLIGFLNRKEISGLNWLTGQGQGGIVEVLNEEKHQIFNVEILSMKSLIIPHLKGKMISFDVHIEGDVRLLESWNISEDALNDDYIKKLENPVQIEVTRLVQQTLAKIQKVYKADVAGFGDQIRIHYPLEWQKMKKKWDDQFSQAQIKTNIKIHIRDYGVKAKKT